MADHEVQIVRNRDRFTAVCACGRWRSQAFVKRDEAETKGMAHEVRGDEHLRALAQFERGTASLAVTLKWYEAQAADPTNSDRDRELWAGLADELRRRVKGPQDSTEQPLLFD